MESTSLINDQKVLDSLNTYARLHIVKAILAFLTSLIFIIGFFFGTYFSTYEGPEINQNAWNSLGSIFLIIGIIGTMIYIIIGILNLMAAAKLRHPTNYGFILFVCIVNCLTSVLGMILGIVTIIEIYKPETKNTFLKSR